jgi:prepilin-type N-terminal cleavage/methylation domain-containing protein
MKKGFTLMELIVVMAIIVFFANSSNPYCSNAVKKAKATQIGRNIRNLIDAGEKYYYT